MGGEQQRLICTIIVTMDLDEWQELQAALRQAARENAQLRHDVAVLRGQLDQLIEVLVGRGALVEGHRRLLEKVGERTAAAAPAPKVRLRQWVDKYKVPNADIDCAARLHLCKARCCSFTFELSDQDLDEGVVRWELDQPYLIRHNTDGTCAHLQRDTLGCGVYLQRPAACRSFDCRRDPRIWIDFDQRIPAP
jgi:Fe-S-cluster containining protein